MIPIFTGYFCVVSKEDFMNVLSKEYQSRFKDENLISKDIYNVLKIGGIRPHKGINSPLSSQASCMNFWYPFIKEERKEDLKEFLKCFGLEVDNIITIKPNSTFEDAVYKDSGNVLFEWIGPIKSPIGEDDGYLRGHHRTSIDAYILAYIKGKVTQILIEWKFTETYSSKYNTGKFLGAKGIERLARYSPIIARDRKKKQEILFKLDSVDNWGLYDICYEPFYQLLRQHMLGQETIGKKFGDYFIQDYIVMHLSHSRNDKLNILSKNHCEYSKGLEPFIGEELHKIWYKLLNENQRQRFMGAYWDECFKRYNSPIDLLDWADYIKKRYI
jgi:hypothetical protein